MIWNTPTARATLCMLGLSALAMPALAAVHCVDTPGQLQAALTAAANSPEDDEVRIRSGHYLHTFALTYYGGYPDRLDLSGGWVTAQGDPCGAQILDARATRLDGGTDHQILRLESFGEGQPGQSARYTVSNLHLDNGFGQGTVYGGGLHMKNMSTLPAHYSVENVIFTRNKAMFGGALHIYAPRGTVRIANSLFDDNVSSTQDIGHLYAIVGGAEGSQMHIVNSTFGRGRCSPGGGANRCGVTVSLGFLSHLEVRNTVFWENALSDLHVVKDSAGIQGATFVIDRSLAIVSGDVIPVVIEPLQGDPMFEDVATGNYALLDESPFIDQGSTTAPFGGLFPDDVHGNPRVRFGRIDPGALENQSADVLFVNGFQQ